LEQWLWLRQGGGNEDTTFEVTLGPDYNPARCSLLILEPMVLEVSGFLQPLELQQVATWAVANAELIQDCWDGLPISAPEVAGRVRPVPAQRW
jgi:hypothetical protein